MTTVDQRALDLIQAIAQPRAAELQNSPDRTVRRR